jgi:hypothetical protein
MLTGELWKMATGSQVEPHESVAGLQQGKNTSAFADVP